MFEKEAKERARDYTSNKERQVAYECGFLDGADKAMGELIITLKGIPDLEKEKCELLGIIQGKDKAIKNLKEENAKLKSQIEKMKCCANCDFVFRDGNCYYDKECKNKDHWKLRR